MLDLSPTKILIVLVVAVIVLGPNRLPHLARQLGAGWRRLRAVHQSLDREIRQQIPDLPSSQELLGYARSPTRFLDRLAQMPAAEEVGATGGAAGGATGAATSRAVPSIAAAMPSWAADGSREGTGPTATSPGRALLDDPSFN